MKLSIRSPTRAYIVSHTDEELNSLEKQLTYTNTSVQHLIRRHYQNHFWKSRNLESWQEHLESLQKDLNKCLVFDDRNDLYIRSGSIPYLKGFDLQIENNLEYPKTSKLPWKHPLPFDLYNYQKISCERLISHKHANVSLTTASGKTAIILELCHQLGLNTCVVVPSKSIFNELVLAFQHHFGKKHIGMFGDGKKKLDKKITICIADSLANVKPDSPEYEFFYKLGCLIVDESHEFAAESLEAVCHGVLQDIPYRFFLSATQIRNDGSLPLLQSIIGETVSELSTSEAVQKGYISDHEFRIVSLESSNPSFQSSDALEQKRVHFLNNKNIAQFTAKLANGTALIQGKQTLVLCQELSQLSMLVPLLKVPYALAHSEKKRERLEELGLEKVNVSESVEKFNKNEVKVLIGTSCIATGTNIYPTHSTVNWVGGSSAIKTKQGAVGRSVRLGKANPWASKCALKDKAIIYDFDIDNPTMEHHLLSRLECYKESGTPIKYIRLKA